MGSTRLGRAAGLFTLLLLVACSGSCSGSDSPAGPNPNPDPDPDPDPTPAAVASVSVEPSSGELSVGGTLSLTARLRDSNGATLTGRTITWSSSETGVATVNATGQVAAVAPGTATISATSEGRSGTATLTVVPPPVDRVEVAPGQVEVSVGEQQAFTATPYDAAGTALTDRTITWSSANSDVATVDAAGVATGVGAGTTTITATSEGRSATAAITVRATPVASVVVAPSTLSLLEGAGGILTVQLRDAGGTLLTGRAVQWASSNTAVATVDGAGRVQAGVAGSATISATSEGVVGTATVTVLPVQAPVASVEVLVSGSTVMQIGEARTLTARVLDTRGGVVTDREVTWVSSHTGVVTGASAGIQAVVTALDLGAATVTAVVEGLSDDLLFQVAGPLTCATVRGSQLFANDGQYLGSLTNQFDAESILNTFGNYGSSFSSTSIYNSFSQYGSAFSQLSAYNTVAAVPPRLRKNNLRYAYVTKNVTKVPRVDPDDLRGCVF